MSEAARFIAEGWSTDGLPGHLVDDVPLTVEVTVYQSKVPMPPLSASGAEWDAYCAAEGEGVTHHVQLERDDRPLTLKDKRPQWAAGEREGWLER